MKSVIVGLSLICLVSVADGARREKYGWGTGSNPNFEQVDGYTRRDGTYVEPYYRTQRNNTLNDNYGTNENYNPWNGRRGSGPTDFDNYGDFGTQRRRR